MSPMSNRMVEISAVMVASTLWRDVMIECVASTRARISSRSTFTASMAAVKSSMSRSHARTMRRTWFISPLLLDSKSFSSPTSYFKASRSSAMVSRPADAEVVSRGRMPLAPRLRCDSFLSKSPCILESCAVICASKSCSRVETFFRICASVFAPDCRKFPAIAPSSPPSWSLRSTERNDASNSGTREALFCKLDRTPSKPAAP
mmetsp:Transcript_24467/g.59351  ORF Transcript_24467/g.59351 Transcript_24467/m.59351 type:complete len:204 (-) Transcript_24467:186-797(-)